MGSLVNALAAIVTTAAEVDGVTIPTGNKMATEDLGPGDLVAVAYPASGDENLVSGAWQRSVLQVKLLLLNEGTMLQEHIEQVVNKHESVIAKFMDDPTVDGTVQTCFAGQPIRWFFGPIEWAGKKYLGFENTLTIKINASF